jgi:hypothetical protein
MSLDSGYVGEIVSMSGTKSRKGTGLRIFGGSYSSPGGLVASTAIAPNPNRVWLNISNSGTAYLYLSLGESGGNVFHLNPGDSVTFDRDHPWTGSVFAISDDLTAMCFCEASIAST